MFPPETPQADLEEIHVPGLPPPPPAPRLRLPGTSPAKTAGDEPQPPEVLLSPDGRWLAALSSRGTAGLWSLPDATRTWCGRGASALAFSPDGRRLAAGHLDGTVRLLAPRTGADARPVVLTSDRREGFTVSALAFDPEGRRLAVERRAVYDFKRYRVEVYRLDLEEMIRLATGHAGRRLERADLPRELRLLLGPASTTRKKEPDEEERRIAEARKLYLKALGLPVPQATNIPL